jgi:hypothetical protein
MLRLFFSNWDPHYGILMGMAHSRMMDQFQALPTQMIERIQNANMRGMYIKGLTDFPTWWVEQGDFLLDGTFTRDH